MQRVWSDRENLGEFEGFAVTLEPTTTPTRHSDEMVLSSAP
jgi:hypothetical protein